MGDSTLAELFLVKYRIAKSSQIVRIEMRCCRTWEATITADAMNLMT
jgi:hypothetical protein